MVHSLRTRLARLDTRTDCCCHQVVTGIFVDSAVTTRTEDEVVDAFKAAEKIGSEKGEKSLEFSKKRWV